MRALGWWRAWTQQQPRALEVASLVLGGDAAEDAGGVTTLALGVEDLEHVLPDLAGLLGGVETLPDTGLLVVADDGSRLGVVGSEALLEGLRVVVGALDEGLASDVILHILLGRVEGAVVGASGSGVDEAAGNAGDEQGVVDLQLDSVLKLLVARLEHSIESLSLGDCTGEAVEDEASLALLVVLQLLLNHANDDVIADETTLVHDLLGFPTERSLLGDLGSQHVTSGQMTAVELLLDLGSLGALASTWGADEDHANLLGGELAGAASRAVLKSLDSRLEALDRVGQLLDCFLNETAHFDGL